MADGLQPYPRYKESGVLWLGKVPDHWTTAAVKRHYAIQLGKMLQGQPSGPNDKEIPYLKAQHVQWFAVRTSGAPKMWASPRDIEQFGISTGDLLVCEGGEGGRCGIVKEITRPYIIQNALHRVRPLNQCRNDFLQYVMSAVAETGWFDAINSKATIAHFTREKFGSLAVPIPSLYEQSGIVRFLDHADQLIRRYIRAKRRLIELLNEQKQAIIHRAVTRGLDPNVQLRSSAVGLLKEVPCHWVQYTIGQVAESIQTGPFGSQLHANEYVAGGIPVINPLHLRNGRIMPNTKFAIDAETAQRLSRHKLMLGDIVLARRGELGRCGLVNEDEVGWLCGTGSMRLRLKSGFFNLQYFLLLLSSTGIRESLSMRSIGATMENLNSSIVAQTRMLCPPIAEQQTIVDFVARMTEQIDQSLMHATKEIDLIREYRTRLIADVVTGKLDVRAAALPEAIDDQPEENDELLEGSDELNEPAGGDDSSADAALD